MFWVFMLNQRRSLKSLHLTLVSLQKNKRDIYTLCVCVFCSSWEVTVRVVDHLTGSGGASLCNQPPPGRVAGPRAPGSRYKQPEAHKVQRLIMGTGHSTRKRSVVALSSD